MLKMVKYSYMHAVIQPQYPQNKPEIYRNYNRTDLKAKIAILQTHTNLSISIIINPFKKAVYQFTNIHMYNQQKHKTHIHTFT